MQTEPQALTVSQLNNLVKKLLETEFPQIWVEGEISNFKRYPSGHMYLSLKDDKAQISAVMFAGHNRYLNFTPKDGLKIKAKVKVSLYTERGNFQLIIEYMEQAGEGDLKRAFELLKNKLAMEGLFEAKHKKMLPSFPQQVGIITSAKGAAIRDILTTLKRRFPSLPIIIYPVLVQGATAAASIAQAIALANQRQECDVLIVGRGGGSLEDLQAFNEEIVARAIFSSGIPIVSAVGHEIDITIADFVADVRAATPTAAAELITPHQAELQSKIYNFYEELLDCMQNKLSYAQEKITWLKKRLKDPKTQLWEYMQRLDRLVKSLSQGMLYTQHQHQAKIQHVYHKLLHASPLRQIEKQTVTIHGLVEKLQSTWEHYLQQKTFSFLHLANQLDNFSPLKTLARGYAIVKDKNNKILTNSNQVAIGDTLSAQLAEGVIHCEVINKE